MPVSLSSSVFHRQRAIHHLGVPKLDLKGVTGRCDHGLFAIDIRGRRNHGDRPLIAKESEQQPVQDDKLLGGYIDVYKGLVWEVIRLEIQL